MFINKKVCSTSVLFAAAALAGVPGVASAHETPSVKSVNAHVAQADRALDRSVSLFERDSDRRAQQLFAAGDQQLRLAERDANKLRQQAGNDGERSRAAQAEQIVAGERDESIEQLVSVLDEADGRAEQRIAKAILTDTRQRAKTIVELDALLGKGVSQRAEAGIADAMAELAQNRDDEVRDQAEALSSEEVSSGSKRLVGRSLKVNVESQERAAYELGEMIADPEVGENAKEGLRVAYEAVMQEQRNAADILEEVSSRVPAAYRSFVEQAEQGARENYQQLEDERSAGWGNGTGSGEGTGTGDANGGTGTGEGTGTSDPSGSTTTGPDSTTSQPTSSTPTGSF